MNRVKRHTKQAIVGTIGGIVVLVGLVAIPYPGPGWLIVFSGLAILSIEFAWARRVLLFGRRKYEAWSQWVKAQNHIVRGSILLMTCAVVVVTLWLLNGYGFMNQWLGLGYDWVESPLPVPGK